MVGCCAHFLEHDDKLERYSQTKRTPSEGNERGHGNDDDGNVVMNEKFSTKAGSFCLYIVSKDF